jgi:hypothetical protein
MDHSGNFVVAYLNYTSTTHNVVAQQFGRDGSAQSGALYVASSPSAVFDEPSVAVTNGGNFVVNYTSSPSTYASATLRTRIYYTPVYYYPFYNPPVYNTLP